MTRVKSPPRQTAAGPGPYEFFLDSRLGEKWKRLGLRRRAGVLTPLFSIYSSKSCGIGEFPDLELLADWCVETGLSIIQLLPMNDVGTAFRPYDADSTFALEPVYIRLDAVEGVDPVPFKARIAALKKEFPVGRGHVDYGIKAAKLAVLRDMYASPGAARSATLARFAKDNRYWLQDYALYRVLKESHGENSWETWPYELRSRDPRSLAAFRKEHRAEIAFQEWLQWQLSLQFRAAKRAIEKRGVLVLGDIPFLVARDSADVWAHQDYFKLELISGAPPDAFFARGQRWGMPPYNWERIAQDGHAYLKEKLKSAEGYYDLFRIDHVVGVFRLWTIGMTEPPENGGLNGAFDPADESRWEGHGRALLEVMADASRMLPCAEDLGVVPACSYRVLHEFGIPGIEVERWTRHWGDSYEFKRPSDFRANAIAMLSTHDTTSLGAWWTVEAGTADEELFKRKCAERHIDYGRAAERLFETPLHGRLRWKPGIGVHDLFDALGIPQEHGQDFLDIFRTSADEREKFMIFLGMDGAPPPEMTPGLAARALQRTSETSSVFAIQTLQDWLSLDPKFDAADWEFRINFPGTVSGRNWTLTMPYPLEKMMRMAINRTVQKINADTGRDR